MEKENDLPHRTREFLRNIGIQDTSTHNEQKTRLVGHVFDCLSALEQLVQLDNENENKIEGETQSVSDRNIKSLGQLVHELVSYYYCYYCYFNCNYYYYIYYDRYLFMVFVVIH